MTASAPITYLEPRSDANEEQFFMATPFAENANALRIAMSEKVLTPAIHIGTFHSNDSCMNDEILLMRLCQLVVLGNPAQRGIEYRGLINVFGPTDPRARPVSVRAKDIKGIKFAEPETELIKLTYNHQQQKPEHLHVYVIVRWGYGSVRAEWDPVATVLHEYRPQDKGFLFRVRRVGQLPLRTIVDEANSQMDALADEISKDRSIYFAPLPPRVV